jgi:hypothetical protein
MGANDVTVSTNGTVEMRLERIDDANLKIRYAGLGLEICSMQVRYYNPDYQDEFIEDVRACLTDNANGELNYCVDAKIALARLRE